MTDEIKKETFRERFNKYRSTCNNSAYVRPHDYETPPKEETIREKFDKYPISTLNNRFMIPKPSLWQRIKKIFQRDVIIQSTCMDHPRNRFDRIFRSQCDHKWGRTGAHDVWCRPNSDRRPVECEKCYTLKWVSIEEYRKIHKLDGDIGIPEVNLELKGPPITGPMRRLKGKWK